MFAIPQLSPTLCYMYLQVIRINIIIIIIIIALQAMYAHMKKEMYYHNPKIALMSLLTWNYADFSKEIGQRYAIQWLQNY